MKARCTVALAIITRVDATKARGPIIIGKFAPVRLRRCRRMAPEAMLQSKRFGCSVQATAHTLERTAQLALGN